LTRRAAILVFAVSTALALGAGACDSDGGPESPSPTDTAEGEDGTDPRDTAGSGSADGSAPGDTVGSEGDGPDSGAVLADVTDVSTSGSPGDYTFRVTVRSPDTGCEQYADWWEVVSTDGELLNRRILAHSHTDEQPFTRSGGPVDIEESETVVVRAHMASESAEAGYGGRAMRGSPAEGFETADLESGFAADLEGAEPQPDDCAF